MVSLKKIESNAVIGDFSNAILFLSLLLVGGFNEFIACFISIVLSVYLFIKIQKERCFKIKINLLSASLMLIVVFYGLSVLWAVDSGMAFIGFLKFLPLLLYLSVLQQTNQTNRVFERLPYYVAILTIVSAIGTLIPFAKDWFLVADRFAGTFQYPNAFAILLLIAELLMFKKDKWNILDYATVTVLIGGLLYTGSRTVFLLFLAFNFLMILTKFSGKKRIVILGIAVVAVTAVLGVALLGPENNVFSRFIKMSLTESTFVGRFLYMQDALPMLLKHPFGMGYFGYFYAQGAVQTGVYSVSFVHNDILQIALDVGIIPALMFVAAIIRYLFKKYIPLTDKLIVLVFTLHNMFDFNLQFVGMFMLYMIFLYDDDGKEITVTDTTAIKITLPILVAVNLYMSIPFTLSYFSEYEAAHKLYPYYTRNTLLLLEQEEDVNKANEIAQGILEYNTSYYAPYSIQAKYAYSQGDFISVMSNKKEVFARNRFGYRDYEEYSVMLINGIIAYERMGDSGSAGVLKKELRLLKQEIESLNDHVSKLGSMIIDQPVTQLPEEVLSYMNYLNGKGSDSH